ncbi:winged helix DNA-binding domain-containing protein [Streptomyces sp. NPDC001536]|uniref:winged helix DNA-binding domain-containing protein n=1 Tax=Streptomyces sp. NPDC001536 TaxID=3364583 RepID=UPI0036CB9822
MTVRITWTEASARRLERQFLATSAKPGVPAADVVATMLGAHAQVLSAAELSVGVRTEGTTRADVREALWQDRSLVKTHGPRGTVHLLPTAELPLWCAALPAVPTGSVFTPDVRVSEEQAEQIVAAIGDALDGVCLTVDELGEEVVARTGAWAGDLVMPAFQTLWPRWRQVLHRAGWAGALCFGPNRGRKVTYTRPPHFDPLPADDAVRTLVRRYLRAYGPATPAWFAKWLAAPGGWSSALFGRMAQAGEIEEVDFEGTVAWVVAGDTEFPGGGGGTGAGAGGRDRVRGVRGVRGVRLLPYFDSYGIAAQPRELLFPGAAYQRALAGGQAGNFPLLLVDGVVAGVWHQRRRGRRTTVTVEPLRRLTARQLRELGERVERVGEVLEAEAELVVGEVTVGPHA